jgi:hypothetical protein
VCYLGDDSFNLSAIRASSGSDELASSFHAPPRLKVYCDALRHNGIVDCWSHRKAAQVDRGLRSLTRRRANAAKGAPDPAVEEIATAIVEPDDSESVRPPAPHPELDKLIGRFNGLKTMVVDAAAARRLLAINTGNRHISRRRVTQLASQMRLGHFENTGEPIIVSDEAILNNGQHRLLAVIEADAAVEMDIRFGIPRLAFVKTDTGAARSGADVLSIRGIAGAARVAMALRLLIAYDRGLPDHLRDYITNDEINRAFDRWPDIGDAVAKVQVYRFPPQIRSTPLYVTTYLAMRAPKAARVDDWLHMLATGLDAHRSHPAYVLRERLLRGVGDELGTRERQLLRFALMIKSWNMFRHDEEVSMREFRWSSTGRDPEAFPRVAGARLN